MSGEGNVLDPTFADVHSQQIQHSSMQVINHKRVIYWWFK